MAFGFVLFYGTMIIGILLNLLIVVVLLAKGRNINYMDIIIVSLCMSDVLQASVGHMIELQTFYTSDFSEKGTVPPTSITLPTVPATSITLPIVPTTSITVLIVPTTSITVPIVPTTSIAVPTLPTTSITVPAAPTTSITVSTVPTSSITVPVAPTIPITVPRAPTTSIIVPSEATTPITVPRVPTTSITVPREATTSITVPTVPTTSITVPPNIHYEPAQYSTPSTTALLPTLKATIENKLDPRCKISGFTVTFLSLTSILHLAAVAVERRFVLLNPLKARMWMRRKVIALYVILPSWFGGLFWALCPLLGWGSYIKEDGEVHRCSINVEGKDANNLSYSYNLLFWCYVVPIVAMAYCFIDIRVALKHVDDQGTNLGANLGIAEEMIDLRRQMERRVTRMSLVMMVTFVLAWTPYTICLLIQMVEIYVSPHLFSSSAVFAKLSTVYNPVVYIIFMKDFRIKIWKMFRWCRAGGSEAGISGEGGRGVVGGRTVVSVESVHRASVSGEGGDGAGGGGAGGVVDGGGGAAISGEGGAGDGGGGAAVLGQGGSEVGGGRFVGVGAAASSRGRVGAGESGEGRAGVDGNGCESGVSEEGGGEAGRGGAGKGGAGKGGAGKSGPGDSGASGGGASGDGASGDGIGDGEVGGGEAS